MTDSRADGLLSEPTVEARCDERRRALAELFTTRVCKAEERTRHLQEVVDHRFAATERALLIQAAEYERRLEDLNHAHARADEEQARVLPRELFEAFLVDYQQFRRSTESQMAADRSRSMTWTAAIGLAVTIFSLALAYWRS